MRPSVPLFAFVSLLLSSCAVAELTADDQAPQSGKKPFMLSTKSDGIPRDSLSALSDLQSDTELIIIDQIHYKDGKVIIALSREDAVSLGIPESLYDKYYDDIKRVNESRSDTLQR